MKSADYNNQLFKQVQELIDRCDSLSADMKRERKEHKKEINDLKAQHIKEIHELRAEHKKEISELNQRVEKLEVENTKLKNDNDRLKKIINNNSNNSSKPPSSDIKKNIPNNREKTNKKAGGQKGRPRGGRTHGERRGWHICARCRLPLSLLFNRQIFEQTAQHSLISGIREPFGESSRDDRADRIDFEEIFERSLRAGFEIIPEARGDDFRGLYAYAGNTERVKDFRGGRRAGLFDAGYHFLKRFCSEPFHFLDHIAVIF